MFKIKKLAKLFLLIGTAFILIGGIKGDLNFAAHTATYGNFDVPGTESWVMQLKPGVDDLASRVEYGKFSKEPLIAIATLFIIVLIASVYKNKKDIISRKTTQWLCFVIARLGVLRVSGVCPIKRTELGVFPFLNCMACEMATGACPIGMFQKSLMEKKIPYLVLGILIISGAILGRAVCGWLCPFGFVADIFDRASMRKLKVPKVANYLKYGMLIFLFSAFLWTIPIFCILFCPSGTLLGLTPYYLTTGLPAVKAFVATSGWLKSFLTFHIAAGIVFIIGAVLISGRWFCRYLCPLGAWYGLFNYVSPICVKHDSEKCTHCGRCKKICPMGVDLERGNFSDITGCIRCGRCTKLCEARKLIIKEERNYRDV